PSTPRARGPRGAGAPRRARARRTPRRVSRGIRFRASPSGAATISPLVGSRAPRPSPPWRRPMAIRVAINGFGRIGRLVFRVLSADPRFEVVRINDLSDAATLAHLLKFDSTHGRFNGTVAVSEGKFTVNGKDVRITAEKDPANLKWGDQ